LSESVLIDTHVLLWYDAAPEQLSPAVRALLQQRSTTVLVSAVSALEIAVKFRLGKLPQAERLISRYGIALERYGFQELPLDSETALAVAAVVSDHADPFDRVLAAQALRLDVPLVTKDAVFRSIPALITLW